MLDSSQGGSLTAASLLDPQVITTTTLSPSGYWRDVSQDEGYILVVVSYGTITATSAQVQLESSASSTGSSPASGGTAAQLPAVLAAGSPTQQTLLLPASFFANRYVGASCAVTGTGNVPVSIVLLGSGDKL